MSDTLFATPAPIPESVLLSIYSAYPRKENRKEALKRIAQALDRICGGEIDGHPRTQAEAIAFLRKETDRFRLQMAGREAKWIPHPTSFFHQSRYLRSEPVPTDIPARMEECIAILAEYPLSPTARSIAGAVQSFLPALRAVDKALSHLEGDRTDEVAVEYLQERTRAYACAVAKWQESDLQYVPSAKRFYEEMRYEQPDTFWERRSTADYNTERSQIHRLLQ